MRLPYVARPAEHCEDGWYNFFADRDFELSTASPRWWGSGSLWVTYGDRECFFARPAFDPRKWTYLNYPFATVPGDVSGVYDYAVVSELSESDVVLGTGGKAAALLEEVRRKSPGKRMLFVNHLCTPVVMGDSLEAFAEQCREAAGCPTVNFTRRAWDQGETFSGVLQALEDPATGSAAADPCAVNLIDFPQRYRTEELIPLLEALGLKVNAALLPEWNIPTLRRLPGAGLQVFCGAALTEKGLRQALRERVRENLAVAPPYGMAASWDCLRRIAAAAGNESAAEGVWRERLADLRREWEDLVRRAREYRLGFVATASVLPRLLRPRLGQDPPLLQSVLEMGFGVDVLVYSPTGRAPRLPAAQERLRLRTFRSRPELERLLREGEFRAVYSDIFFDWRLSAAGKAQFSCLQFEMGAAGAVRSLKRLLALCRLPFYERYAPWLGGLPGRSGRPD